MMLVKTKLGQSQIHGIGLFADEFIQEGTPVWKFTPGLDFKLTAEEVQKLPELAKEVFLHYAYHSNVDDTHVLTFDNARFFNHSRTPNVRSVDVEGEPEGMEVATRDIAPGEELVCDC